MYKRQDDDGKDDDGKDDKSDKDGKKDGKKDRKKNCFYLEYPVSLELPDGSTIKVNDKKEAMDFIATEGTLNKLMTKYLKEWNLFVIDKMFITAGDIALVKDENDEELVGVCTGNMIACVCEAGFTFKGNMTAKKVWRINDG